MSGRVTRPRSRRGRHPPPVSVPVTPPHLRRGTRQPCVAQRWPWALLQGELDPVAESSEEAEAASGGPKPGPGPPQGDPGSQLLGAVAEGCDPGPESRSDKEADEGGGPASAPEGLQEPAVEARQALEAASQDGVSVPSGTGTPNVFQSLQDALSSLEAAAAAWRLQPPSWPGPLEAEGRHEGPPDPCPEQDRAGSHQQEVARLSERNSWLRLALGSREDELLRTQASLQAARAEKETLQRDVQELQDTLMRLESPQPRCHSQAGGLGSDSSSSGADEEPWGPQDSPLAHPLLRRLGNHASSQILGPPSAQPPAPDAHAMAGHMEQLRGDMEKLKCFNRLLLTVLQGCKGHCEGLTVHLGQREAEATALRLALQYSEDCEEAYGALLALQEADSRAVDKVPSDDLQVAKKEACRLLAEKEATMDGGTPRPSPEGSSVDKPTPREVAVQLRGFVRRLQGRRALLKVPPEPGPAMTPRLTVPHTEAMVQAILDTQLGPALPRLDKKQIQQDLVATREALADLTLQLQLVRREKRGLELRDVALRAQGPAHVLLLEQLRWERAQLTATRATNSSGGGSSEGRSSDDEEEWPQGPPAVLGGTTGTNEGQTGRVWEPEKLSQELAMSHSRSEDLQQQLRSLRERLEQVARKGRARRAQSAELNRDLCKAHSSLVLALRGAHRKQEAQCGKLEQQVALMQARQAEELARLEATARALASSRPPQLGETLL
uniref:Usher syndrome type-1C protein-binding protein 1 n=1 Tax=Castor canadensis TaxID=51338 RepID=A0A250Y4K8_CASCN